MKKLNEDHAVVMNEIWPHKFKGSLDYLKTFIKMNGGFGVFLKEDDSIVAWILKNQMGMMVVLQTADGYKRKGYGSLVTKAIAKEIAKEGHVPLGTVLIDNFASKNMFKKLGFKIIDQLAYIQYHCT